MGCALCKSKDTDNKPKEPKKKKGLYSWDKRDKVDPKQFTIDGVKNQTVGRLPGQINGQQFIIQNCENANIYLFDNIAQITIDDCTNCRLFIGPVKGSAFLRDCRDCAVVIACQQLRLRDCRGLGLFVHCATQPIIESSTDTRWACFQYHYEELEDQFKAAELSLFNNNWSNVYDFTPVEGEKNWSLLPQEARVVDNVPLPDTEQFKGVKLSTHPKDSLVPLSLGSRSTSTENSCLVVFFCDGQHAERALNFIDEMRLNRTECQLVRSREVTMREADATKVFQTDTYTPLVNKGTVVGLEYTGPRAIDDCKAGVVAIATGATGLVFVTSVPGAAQQVVDAFFAHADMQLQTA